jgi:hypothetical protein
MSRMFPRRLSRRTFLRGAGGVALALPMLDAMAPRAARGAAAAPPRRIMFVFQANGDQIARRFKAVGETAFQFDEFLAPLEPYRGDLLLLNNLDKRFGKLPSGSVADNHEQGGSSLAPWPSGTGSYPIGGAPGQTIGFVQGPSADRAIGDAVLAKNPSLPYRHLVYRVGGNHNDIWNLHSHAGPMGTQSPIPPETDPYAAYTRIFTFNATDGAAQSALKKRLAKKQSALDLVLAEATTLSAKVGKQDKAKLDLHMTSLRDIERTLATGGATAPAGASCAPADLGAKLDVFDDANHVVIGELFFKISALAFACDLTRTIQFNWSGNTSNRVYKNLGITDGHHDISHMTTDDAFAKIRQIHTHLWTQNLKLYETLKATPDGNGTSLWDNTLVVHWNELAQGDTHAINNNLVVFAGVAQNAFRRGRYLDFANKSSFSDMLLTCFQYMGLPEVTSFGDSRLVGTGMPLAGLT